MEPPTTCAVRLRIAFAVIGLCVGLSIFPCFGFVYHNWNTAIWGLVSGVFAGMTLYAHWRYVSSRWEFHAYQLRPLMILACFTQLAAICGFVAYIATAAVQHQAFTNAYGKAYYVTAVWCFMTWKWGFGLFYYCQNYKRLYRATFHRNPDVRYEPI